MQNPVEIEFSESTIKLKPEVMEYVSDIGLHLAEQKEVISTMKEVIRYFLKIVEEVPHSIQDKLKKINFDMCGHDAEHNNEPIIKYEKEEIPEVLQTSDIIVGPPVGEIISQYEEQFPVFEVTRSGLRSTIRKPGDNLVVDSSVPKMSTSVPPVSKHRISTNNREEVTELKQPTQTYRVTRSGRKSKVRKLGEDFVMDDMFTMNTEPVLEESGTEDAEENIKGDTDFVPEQSDTNNSESEPVSVKCGARGCRARFPTREEAMEHTIENHKDNIYRSCVPCNKTFLTQMEKRAHAKACLNKRRMMMEREKGPWQCEYCPLNNFASYSKYKEHVYNHRRRARQKAKMRKLDEKPSSLGVNVNESSVSEHVIAQGVDGNNVAADINELSNSMGSSSEIDPDRVGKDREYSLELAKQTPTRDEAMEHTIENHKDNIYRSCVPCNKTFLTQMEKRAHAKTCLNKRRMMMEREKGPWQCEYCPLNNFASYSKYKEHVYNHRRRARQKAKMRKLDEKPSSLGVNVNESSVSEHVIAQGVDGNNVAADINELSNSMGSSSEIDPDRVGKDREYSFELAKQTIVSQQLIPQGWIRCSVQGCEGIFSTKDEAIYHIIQAHPSKAIARLCAKCKQTFFTEKEKRAHSKTCSMGPNKEGPWTCEYCGLDSFANLTKFRAHLYTHDKRAKYNGRGKNTAAVKVPCEICGALVNRFTIKNHIKHHTKPFACTDCGKTFSQQTLLDVHRIRKHGDRSKVKHQCSHCDKVFMFKSTLATHVKGVHMKKYDASCEICDKIFPCESALRGHFANVHAEKKFVCPCGAAFGTKSTFKTHTKLCQNNETPVTYCSYCKAKLSGRAALTAHENSVHRPAREFTYPCDFCEQGFFVFSKYNRHLGRIHKMYAVKGLDKKLTYYSTLSSETI